jgi:transcriptional regulator with XRE-family HTH domain
VNFTNLKKKLGTRIKELRESKGLTQEDMDEGQNGLPVRTFQDIERGNSNVTLKSLNLIARRLEVELKDLFNF